RDLAGNVSSDTSDADFTVDGLPPDLRITGPTTANDVPVKIEWQGGDLGGSGLKRVTLYVTRDGGQTWKLHGDDPGLKSPFVFTELDGAYGLKLVGEDKMGNANPAPVAGMPPRLTLPACHVRISAADFAGNVREVISERFGIDGTVPEARATGPDRSNS